MPVRTLAVRSTVLTAVVLASATISAQVARAQVGVTFYATFPSTAPDPAAPFPGGPVICSANPAGTSTGFRFDFFQAATRVALCPSSPDRIAASQLFGARIVGSLLAPTAGTYSLLVESDDGSALTVNGTNVLSRWFIQGGPPQTVTLSLNAGLNPFVLDYYQGNCCGAFIEFRSSGGVTMVAPTQVIPEPSTIALGSVGVLGVGIIARRRRRTNA